MEITSRFFHRTDHHQIVSFQSTFNTGIISAACIQTFYNSSHSELQTATAAILAIMQESPCKLASPVKKCRMFLEQSFTAHMSLMAAIVRIAEKMLEFSRIMSPELSP